MPTLHLPEYTRPFFLFTHVNQGQALGLLHQQTGGIWALIAYLWKQLDMVTNGWPPAYKPWPPLQSWYLRLINSLDMLPLWSVPPTHSEISCHTRLFSPFFHLGYRSYMLFYLTPRSPSPLVPHSTLPAYCPHPLTGANPHTTVAKQSALPKTPSNT